jgi:hypothetical protein
MPAVVVAVFMAADLALIIHLLVAWAVVVAAVDVYILVLQWVKLILEVITFLHFLMILISISILLLDMLEEQMNLTMAAMDL